SSPMTFAVGTSSCNSSSRFGPTSAFNDVTRQGQLRPDRTLSRRRSEPSWLLSWPPVPQECYQARPAHLTTDQIGRQWRQSIVLTVRPPIFDRHVAAFDITGFAQALVERAHTVHPAIRRCTAKKPNHRHSWLLRARRERPRCCRAAEQRDELPPPHSITSSARASSLSGIWRPSAFAVLRLMTNSNLVGCMTGRSAGFSPLRIRPV